MPRGAASTKVAVASRSFSRNTTLRAELESRYAKVTFNDDGAALQGEELVEFLDGHQRAIVGIEPMTESVISRLPELEIVAKYGVGLDNLDLGAMQRHGVQLGWKAGVNRRAVSEAVLAGVIVVLRGLHRSFVDTRLGKWRQIAGRQLTGKTIGVIGFGHVGRDLTLLVKPFECQILVTDTEDRSTSCRELGASQVDLRTLLIESDVVSVHVPLNDSTRGLISGDELALMKRDSVLVNAARGGIVDEDALFRVLVEHPKMAAVLDVLSEEPPSDNRLVNLENAFVTSHVSGLSVESVLAMGRAAIVSLEAANDLSQPAHTSVPTIGGDD